MSVLTLFVQPGCYLSDLVQYMLAEKGVEYYLIDVSDPKGHAQLQLNPQLTRAPALSDRGVRIDDLDVMIEYIEDRYPHPIMLPTSPSERAAFRVFFRRVLRDFFPLLEKAELQKCETSGEALRAEIASFAPVFQAKRFFMSDEISLLDVALAPIVRCLHRRKSSVGTHANKYIARMVRREAFQKAIPC